MSGEEYSEGFSPQDLDLQGNNITGAADITAQASTDIRLVATSGNSSEIRSDDGTNRVIVEAASAACLSSGSEVWRGDSGVLYLKTDKVTITNGSSAFAHDIAMGGNDITGVINVTSDAADDLVLAGSSGNDAYLSGDQVILRYQSTARVKIDSTGISFLGQGTPKGAVDYTLNATAVEDRTLLASASATTINNNNVLAAIITDMQGWGFFT